MHRIKVKYLQPGMKIAEDVYGYGDELVLSGRFPLTNNHIDRLKSKMILTVAIDDESYKDYVNGKTPNPTETSEEAPQKTPEPDPKPDPAPAPPIAEPSKEVAQIISSELSYDQRLRQTPEFKALKENFTKYSENFGDKINDIATRLEPTNVNAIVSDVLDLLDDIEDTGRPLSVLANLRSYDDTTWVHSLNVALLCSLYAGWSKMSKAESELLIASGIFHDIGKTKIPDRIVKKTSRLDQFEYEIMKKHTIEGYNILKKIDVDEKIANAALRHHERSDGTGYPHKLLAKDIDLFSSIIAVIDSYDAMSSSRSYKEPLCSFKVIDRLYGEGFLHYDPKVEMFLLKRIAESYLQSKVLLNNGMECVVAYINDQMPGRPLVMHGTTGIDLSVQTDLSIVEIL